MQLYYSDQFTLPLPADHRFPMAKYQQLRNWLQHADWCGEHVFRIPVPATDTQLGHVHTPEYIQRMSRGEMLGIEMRRIGFPWSPQLVERARRSVGGTIAAAHAAQQDGIGVNLAGGTHHAFADAGQGYCVFNDTAVAARELQATSAAISRVLIVDLDVHQGNGTAAIFADDPTVFTFSMHSAKNFPFRKHAADLDVSLPDGTTDEPYLDRLDRALDEAIHEIRPDFVFYIAGADPYEGDRLGRLRLTVAGLMARDRMVLTRCRDLSLPVAISMGGGYAKNINEIVQIHANTIFVASQLLRASSQT